MSDPTLLLRVLLLLGVANGTPIVATKVLGEHFGVPLDFGRKLPDGRAFFGPGKTIRGILVSILATSIAALLLGFPFAVGASVATASMAGDLLSSFSKRRLGFKPHAQAFGLDQLPEAFLPLLMLQHSLGLGAIDIAVLVVAFVAGEIVLSLLLLQLGVRERPY